MPSSLVGAIFPISSGGIAWRRFDQRSRTACICEVFHAITVLASRLKASAAPETQAVLNPDRSVAHCAAQSKQRSHLQRLKSPLPVWAGNRSLPNPSQTWGHHISGELSGALEIKRLQLGQKLNGRMLASGVSVWARHLDRAADSGLRLPAVWQQFLNAAVHV
jgi:hypothetical protein